MKIEANGHWYCPVTGEPKHFVEKADSSGELRPTTLRDAKKYGWVPSVTTILKVLHKEALVQWLIRQAVLTVLTAPRTDIEDIDAFVDRVLSKERQQDEEAKVARDRGTEIHDALEKALTGVDMTQAAIWPWIEPCFQDIMKRGKVLHVEKVLIGDGYGGKTDLIQQNGHGVVLWDWKSASKLPPKASWLEHRLQLSAYADAHRATGDGRIASNRVKTANAYISTQECGSYVIHENPPWEKDYEEGFLPLVKYWRWANNYKL